MEALSAIEYVAQGMKDNIYIFTVEGKCSRMWKLLFKYSSNEQKRD